MLHRPADSRLLANLLAHEKEHVKTLGAQLDAAHASLASFSAYAAASPPPASHAIAAVAGALVGANDALRGYVGAVDEWCEQLKMLKEMEDEVGNIIRDREILVDRLIKASKSSNTKRRSLISGNSSNSNISPTTTIFASSSSTALDPLSQLSQLAPANGKLGAAQHELQACETHLGERERALGQMRESAVLSGLRGRCRALVECGWRWGELGKEGLRALEGLSFGQGDHGAPNNSQFKPLPDPSPYTPAHPSSDLSSSLAPSQSASQIFLPETLSNAHEVLSSNGHASSSSTGHGFNQGLPEADIRDDSAARYVLALPPAHAISEADHYIPPAGTRFPLPPPPLPNKNEVEEDEMGGSSDGEDESAEGKFEVHENNPFPQASAFGNESASGADSAKVNGNGSTLHIPLKKQKQSKNKAGSAQHLPASISAPMPADYGSLSRAQARKVDPYGTAAASANLNTNVNPYADEEQTTPRQRKRSTFLGFGALAGLFHRGGRKRTPSLSSEPAIGSAVPPSPSAAPLSALWGGNSSQWQTRTDRNLKKPAFAREGESSDEESGALKRVGTSDTGVDYDALRRKSVIEHKVLPNPSTGKNKNAESAGVERTPTRTGTGGKKKLKKPMDAQRRNSSTTDVSAGAKGRAANKQKDTKPAQSQEGASHATSGSSPSSVTVSRSSTIRSQSTVRSSGTKRAASLDVPPLPTGAGSVQRKRTHSHNGATSSQATHQGALAPAARGQASLMSIVEGVTSQNRSNWGKADPTKPLFEAKAPKAVVPSAHYDPPPTENGLGLTIRTVATMSSSVDRDRESPISPSAKHDGTGGTGQRRVLTGATVINGDLRRLSTISASSSEPSLPLRNHSVMVVHNPGGANKLPLRSALRTRSPSPAYTPSPPRSASPVRFSGVPPSSVIRSNNPATSSSTGAAGVPSQPQYKKTHSVEENDDAASSVSSYETGHEDFDDSPELRRSPPMPPPHDSEDQPTPTAPHKLLNGFVSENREGGGTQISTSSDGTGTATGTASPPSRRKSVRVSLQPTFSPTPPATYDDEDDHGPWGPSPPAKNGQQVNHNQGGWKTRHDEANAHTVWDNSSEEDEEYSRARQMLHKASKKLERTAQRS